MKVNHLITETFEPGIVLIKINRPEALNALNTEVLKELKAVLAHHAESPSSRVIILTGEGSKAFIAGADIAEMRGKSPEEGVRFAQLGQEVTKNLELMPKPTIAAVNGYALGGGTEMAIACDFIVASETAVFGQPEVGLGVIPGFGATLRLSKFVGLPRAKELIFSGRKVKASEAKEIGLANHVFPPEQLIPQTLEIARAISRQSLAAVARAKLLLNEFSETAGLNSKLDAEAQAFGRLFGSVDQIEGMNAFVEKRKPQFQGLARLEGAAKMSATQSDTFFYQGWPEADESKKLLLEQIHSFAETKIKPHAAKIDATGEFPKEIIQQLAEMGIMGMMVPEQWGGSGMDAVSYAMALEEIAAACASTAVIVSVNNSLVCAPLSAFGTDEQKRKFLTPLAQGKKLGCFALSEPGHGSDPAGLECSAKKVPGGYQLKGTKNWITNGKEADYCVVFATLDKKLGYKGICAFIVDTQSKGFQVSKLEDKLGISGSSTAQLFFDDVFVPEDCLLGKEGEGLKIALHTLDGGRIGIAAQALGIARCAFDASKRFASEREQFGAPIAKLQAIQWFIADMATRLQGARLLTWSAARAKDQGAKFTKEAAMAKLAASEAAMWITTKAIQVHGGYGYTKEYVVERNFRDAKITEIYEGTSEIQRLVIAAQEFASVTKG